MYLSFNDMPRYAQLTDNFVMVQHGPITVWYYYQVAVVFEIDGFRVVQNTDWCNGTDTFFLNQVLGDLDTERPRVGRDKFNLLWSESIKRYLWKTYA